MRCVYAERLMSFAIWSYSAAWQHTVYVDNSWSCSLMPRPTQTTSCQRRSSQPITWLILTNKTKIKCEKKNKFMHKNAKAQQNIRVLLWTIHTWYNADED